tara:strand:+ start:3784 stop:4599 length:816 start_codon:yes stop_codon:yes gene_type:complete
MEQLTGIRKRIVTDLAAVQCGECDGEENSAELLRQNLHVEHPQMRVEIQALGGFSLRPYTAGFTAPDGKVVVVAWSEVGLYLPLLQTVGSCLATSAASMLFTMLPQGSVSPPRTLLATVVVAACCVYRPVRVGRVLGLEPLFACLRPSVFVLAAALCTEQLVHACSSEHEVSGTLASAMGVHPTDEKLFHAHIVLDFGHRLLVYASVGASVMRSWSPASESDVTTVVVFLCVFAAALLPLRSPMGRGTNLSQRTFSTKCKPHTGDECRAFM